jgi:probable rRNA maturation factor
MTRLARQAPSLRVSISDALGRPLARGPAAGLAAWVRRVAPSRARGDLAIALIPDQRMRALNRHYRGVDRATDVLSFPGGRGRFGDIAIAKGVASRQATAAGHPVSTELRILALHGVLHLLGYDHEADQGQMERAEERLRRRAGLPTGLIDRGKRAGRAHRGKRAGRAHRSKRAERAVRAGHARH